MTHKMWHRRYRCSTRLFALQCRLHCLAMFYFFPLDIEGFFVPLFSIDPHAVACCLFCGPFGLLNALTYDTSVSIAVLQRNNKVDCLLFFGQQSFFPSGFLSIAKFFPTFLVQVFFPGFLFHSWYCSRSRFVSLRRGRMRYPHDSYNQSRIRMDTYEFETLSWTWS